jgi:transcription termination factor Rho
LSETFDEGAEKYTLVYYMPGDEDTATPPFKYRTYYLGDAVEGAWRNHQAGGNVVSITRGERIVFSHDELAEAFRRISELIPLTPERPLREIAEQVVDERGKS